MQTAFDTLPEQAKILYRKIVGNDSPPIYSFFCENWETKPDLPTGETYLRDYALVAAMDDKAVKLPTGWFKRMQDGEESFRKDLQVFPYEQIEDCRVERFLQSANIVLKLRDKEVRIEKCQPPQADRFLQIVRSKREKQGAPVTQKLEMIYPVSAGNPIGFQPGEDGSIWLMFTKPNAANRGPAEITILVYKDQQVVKSYHFEPRQ